MKTKAIIRVALAIGLLVSFSFLTSSCQSKEEKVISQLESLCKTVERDGFNVKDIDTVQARFKEIHDAAKECNFTNDQVKEIAKLDARFTKAVAKKAVERVGNAFEGALEGLSGGNE